MNQASTPELDALLQHLTELLQSGAHSEAEILAARSRVQFPDDGELIRMHGIALLQLGRRTEAIEMLQHAATVAPHSIEVQCNLAAMQVEDGDADGAIERLRAALRRTPGHPTVLYGLGNALMAAARYTQARESFAMATHGAPGHPGLRLNLATVPLGDRAGYAARWQDLGATHLTVNTMGSGHATVTGHLAALRDTIAALAGAGLTG